MLVSAISQVTGGDGLTPGREEAGTQSPCWVDEAWCSALLLTSHVGTGQHLPCQGSQELLPQESIISCIAEGVLQVEVAWLEDATREWLRKAPEEAVCEGGSWQREGWGASGGSFSGGAE